MTVDQGFYTYVTAQSAITDLISTRLYPVLLPQNATLPAATYRRVDSPRIHSHDGASGLASPRFQVDIWVDAKAPDDQYAALLAIGDAFRQTLDGYSGLMGTVTTDVQLVDERDMYEPDPHYWRRSQDYIIWHDET